MRRNTFVSNASSRSAATHRLTRCGPASITINILNYQPGGPLDCGGYSVELISPDGARLPRVGRPRSQRHEMAALCHTELWIRTVTDRTPPLAPPR